MRESPVAIPFGDGELTAMLHEPELAPRAAVVMPPAGMRDRCGPMRLYARLARRLQAEGHWVLRYDGQGLGESFGRPPSEEKLEAYRAVEGGVLAGEVVAASRWLAERARVERVVVVGLCGGVLHASHLAARAPELVAGLFCLGAPTLRAGPRGDRRPPAQLSR